MTNDTEPHLNGVGELLTGEILAATTTDSPEAPAEPAAAPLPSFDDLGLHPDVKLALDEMGYFQPTAVQTAVYKPVSEGKDLMVQSRTGTGKTTAFGLPAISRLVPTHRTPQVLILAPTRELALQVARELTQIGKHRGIVVEAIYGGAPIGKQIKALQDGVHIVVGTPGRVLDHIGRRTLDCRTITTFILDECDEMLSMGFLEDIERVVSNLPEKKQTLLFSATMPDEVTRYSRRHMKAPETISLSRDGISVTDIHHAYYIVSGIARGRDLLKILFAENPESAIIFCNMRDETNQVARFLQKQGLDAEPLSSDLSQADRERVMGRMKAKNLRFLCATDVAARGIDISNLSHVINYSVPESPEVYVHRTGRTGRAGKKGTALSLVGPRELGNFRYVRLTFGIKPEERVLPKDDIFIGKLKVPLPPIGTPQPPDPVQILIRGVTATANDLERQIFEKLYATQAGKRVLAALVADKLNQLSTKSKPRPARPERSERPADAAPEGGERNFERSEERPRFEERGDRGPAPEGGERPRFSEDRGERPRFDRDRGGERGDRPRFGGDRDRGGGGGGERGGDRGDRPRFGGDRDRGGGGGDRPRFGGDRDRGGDRGDRPRFGDRDRGDRPRFDRDRPEGGAPSDATAAPVDAATATVVNEAPVEATSTEQRTDAPREHREPREGGDRERREYRGGGGRDRDRDRGDRGGRDRHERSDRPNDRGDRPERGNDRPERTYAEAAPVAAPAIEVVETVVAGTEAAPAVETHAAEPIAKVDDVARAALERADRGAEKHDRKDAKRGGKKAEPTADTREFWETWAEEKSTRPAPAPTPAAAAPAAEAKAEAADDEAAPREGRSRGGRGRRGGRDRDRGAKPEAPAAKAEAPAKPEPKAEPEAKAAKKDEPKAERGSRAKRDTTVTPPPVAAVADSSQARLFVSLGKKHGVSADDLRALLAGPVGGDKARIGSVSLRDSHAHVRVPEGDVDAIIAGVHGTQHHEQSVTVERARA